MIVMCIAQQTTIVGAGWFLGLMICLIACLRVRVLAGAHTDMLGIKFGLLPLYCDLCLKLYRVCLHAIFQHILEWHFLPDYVTWVWEHICNKGTHVTKQRSLCLLLTGPHFEAMHMSHVSSFARTSCAEQSSERYIIFELAS